MKKYFLFMLVAVVMLACGCSKQQPDTIKFSTWGSQSEMEILKPIVEKYNSEHNVKVEIIHVPQNYFQKLHLLFASNSAPDVVFVNNLYLPAYQKADLFEDLTPYIDKSEYFENALLTMSVDGKVYAVPRDVSNIVIFYNKNAFKKNGVNIDYNWTIDDFYRISKTMKSDFECGFCTDFSVAYWENFVTIDNGAMFDGEKPTVSEPVATKSFQLLADNINKNNLGAKKEQVTLTPCLQMFLQKKTPILVSGRWVLPKLKSNADFEYGVSPFPHGKSDYYIPLNASGWAVYKNSAHKKEAIDFVKYISNDENMTKMTEQGLITPAKIKIANSNAFEMSDAFIYSLKHSTPNKVPSNYNLIIDKIMYAAMSVLNGYKTSEEAFSRL